MSKELKAYSIFIACLELILGIPIWGGLFIMCNFWTPLITLFILHLIGAILHSKNSTGIKTHIFGMIASVVEFIPFLGMALHLIIGVILLLEVAKK